MTAFSDTAQRILAPSELTHPSDVGTVPAEPGVYGWWVRTGSLDIPIAEYKQYESFALVYVGISPRKPSAAGRVSTGNIRKRLHQHVNGNASQSTLRRTIGVLLMESLDMTLTYRNDRYRWSKEEALTAWMYENARVAYAIDPSPWHAEDELLEHAVLALNIEGRTNDEFAKAISARRRAARETAEAERES